MKKLTIEIEMKLATLIEKYYPELDNFERQKKYNEFCQTYLASNLTE